MRSCPLRSRWSCDRMRTKPLSVSRLVLWLPVLALTLGLGDPQLEESGKGASSKELKAPARSGMEWDPDGKLTRIDFKFDDASAWLRSNGDWYIKGEVQHTRLRCATYQLGMRFGHGNPACVNVKWLTEPRYVTSKKQCNAAIVPHEGGDNDPALASEFENITCAVRLIRCSDGACD